MSRRTIRPDRGVGLRAIQATPARRRVNRLPPERRISDIMRAAKDVFAEKGYSDALITDIAVRAGVVEGSIYRFFVNKRELLIKVVELWFEDLLTQDAEQFAAVRGVWNQIHFIVYNHLMCIRREPALARLMFLEIRPAPDYRALPLFKLNQAYTHRLVDVVEAGIASGELRSDTSPALVRDLVFGSIEHRTWAFLRSEGDFDPSETADAITNLIYRGIAAGHGGGAPLDATAARLEAIAARLEKVKPARRGATRTRPQRS